MCICCQWLFHLDFFLSAGHQWQDLEVVKFSWFMFGAAVKSLTLWKSQFSQFKWSQEKKDKVQEIIQWKKWWRHKEQIKWYQHDIQVCLWNPKGLLMEIVISFVKVNSSNVSKGIKGKRWGVFKLKNTYDKWIPSISHFPKDKSQISFVKDEVLICTLK